MKKLCEVSGCREGISHGKVNEIFNNGKVRFIRFVGKAPGSGNRCRPSGLWVMTALAEKRRSPGIGVALWGSGCYGACGKAPGSVLPHAINRGTPGSQVVRREVG